MLEEAENERMHLVVCIKVFEASWLTRLMVLAGQCVMTPLLLGVYIVQPKAVHRFVGYLEETAVHTYCNVLNHLETPGTLLHSAWHTTPAPEIAKAYWHLPRDAKLLDALKCMMADEANHRDVNHTFASLKTDDPNPFLLTHKEDAFKAWRLENEGRHAWKSATVPIQGAEESKSQSPAAATIKQTPPSSSVAL